MSTLQYQQHSMLSLCTILSRLPLILCLARATATAMLANTSVSASNSLSTRHQTAGRPQHLHHHLPQLHAC